MASRQYSQVTNASLSEPLTTSEDAGTSNSESKPKAEAGDSMPFTPKEFCFWVWRNPTERVGVLIYVLAACAAIIMAIIALIDIASNVPPTSTVIALGIIEVGIFSFAAYGFRRAIALREQVNKFANLNGQMKKENADLTGIVDSFAKHIGELRSTHDSLQRLNARSKENVQKFTQLEANLAKFAGGNLEQMTKIREQTKKMSASWKDSLVKNERSLILKCYEQIQDRSNAEDLTEEQFNQMLQLLPPDYKNFFEKEGKSWKEMTGDDGLMQYDEFITMCDVVVDERVGNQFDQGNEA